MNFDQDTRGVSEVIGAILIFGLAIMLLAILQTQAIPAANEDVEFNHNDEIQGQLIDFHQAAAETARNGGADSTKLEMGLRYPNRLLFFNPPSPAGTLATSDESNVTIENAHAEDDTVGKYMNNGPIKVGTRSLSYRANYNEYRAAPVSKYEYGVLYNDHEDSQLLVNDGGVVQGREISLLMPAGELHESSTRAMSIDPRPVSAPAKTVSITGDGTGPINVTLPSEMNTSLWEEAVDMTHVQNIEQRPDGKIRLSLDGDETYALRMARIGVGGDTPEQTPEYVFSQRGTQFDIPQGQSRSLDIEVRDEYNNPVAHEDVKVAIANGAGSVDNEVSTGADGVARPRFEAPTNPQRVTVNVTLDDNFSDFQPDSDPRDMQLDVWVTSYAGGFGNDPVASINSYTVGCGDDDGNLLDDPIQSISSEDSIVQVDWRATLDDSETNIDTVDVRIIRQGDSLVGDTAVYAYEAEVDGLQELDEESDLVDRGGCGSDYKIRVFVETTGSATDIVTSGTFTAT